MRDVVRTRVGDDVKLDAEREVAGGCYRDRHDHFVEGERVGRCFLGGQFVHRRPVYEGAQRRVRLDRTVAVDVVESAGKVEGEVVVTGFGEADDLLDEVRARHVGEAEDGEVVARASEGDAEGGAVAERGGVRKRGGELVPERVVAERHGRRLEARVIDEGAAPGRTERFDGEEARRRCIGGRHIGKLECLTLGLGLSRGAGRENQADGYREGGHRLHGLT